MKNSFSQETRLLFLYQNRCDLCGKSPVEHHHILGRGTPLHSSPLNLSCLCPLCHVNYGIDKSKKASLLKKTLVFLLSQDYKFEEKDLLFYIENKHYYPSMAEYTTKNTKTP